MRLAVLALTVALGIAGSARADYFDGLRYWDNGQFAKAVEEWRSAAVDGDRQAMLRLGKVYAAGKGVAQDNVEAHRWLSRAHESDHPDAAAELLALESADDAAGAFRSAEPHRGSTSGNDHKPVRSAGPAAREDTGGPAPSRRFGFATGAGRRAMDRDDTACLPGFPDQGRPDADRGADRERSETSAGGGGRHHHAGRRGAGAAIPTASGNAQRRHRRIAAASRVRSRRESAGQGRADRVDAGGPQGLRAARRASARGQGGPQRAGSDRGDGSLFCGRERACRDRRPVDRGRRRSHHQRAEGSDARENRLGKYGWSRPSGPGAGRGAE